MKNCNIIQNVATTLKDSGLIDDKNNIIGPIGQTLLKIDEINNELYNTYGALIIEDIDGNPKKLGLISTGTVNTFASRNTKVFFNREYEQYIDKVRNEGKFEDSNLDNINSKNETIFPTLEEQTIWDNITSKYQNKEEDYSDFGDINNVYNEDEQPLNSPFDNTNDDVFEENPDSFSDWSKSRKQTLNNLKRLHDYYFKLNKKDPILKDINRAIEEIESQIENIDSSNPFTIYDNAVEESEILSLLVEKANEDPTNALQIIETNDLEKRINDLNYYFLGRDSKAGDFAYSENEDTTFYKDFQENFANLNKEEMEKLQSSIRKLKDDFKDTKKTIVKSAFLNNSYVKQHIQTGKLTNENITDIINKIDNGEYEVDTIGSKVLGLASGGGILGQLLYLKKEEASFKENAFIAKKLVPLNSLWNSIKDKKDSAGKYIINNLFQTDKFGVKMNRLNSKYTDLFSTISKQVYAERDSFISSRNSRDYESWMNAEKDNYDRLDVRKFNSIFSTLFSDKRFSKYFEGINKEECDKYEEELKTSLGPIMYEIEKKKAEDLVEDFIHAIDTMTLTPRQQIVKNPFAFLKHFNSENFNKISLEEGTYLEPSYTRFIPKTSVKEYYNEQFKSIENNEELSKYYKGAHDIMTTYCNPTFQGEGISVGALDLETFEDLLERASYEDLNLFGKISSNAKALYRERVQRYTDSTLAKMDDRLSDKNHDRQKLVVGYSGEVRNRISKLKALYSNMSVKELVSLAKQKGISTEFINSVELEKKLKGSGTVKTQNFYDLAESVARAEINKITSTNIQESLHNSAYLAADVRARRSVVGMLEAFKDISKIAKLKQGQSIENKNGDTHIGTMLKMWGQSNVYGEKFAGNMENKGKGLLTRISKFKIPGWKTFTGTDKVTVEEIKSILKMSSSGIVENFEFNDNKFENKDGKFFMNGEEISLEKFKDNYMSMLTKDIGTEATIGSVLLGYMDNLRAIQLGLSPRAGIKNRLAGISQTMSVAASQKYGFNLNQYHAARRFLRGVNTRQYISKLGWAINNNNPKYTQIQMLEQLISNLELQQNRADELAIEAKFNNNSNNKIESFKNFLMDFSMNNPEKHNQLEIAVAVMMDTNVKDKDGNEHNFFDEKGLNFNIYKTGTLELKDEFKTDENIAMWENFQTFKNEESGEQKSDSISMTTRIRTAIEQSQGNYNNNDIIMLQNTVHGKLATMYTRYMYENTNLQFGKHYVDLRTGEMNIKGRKINLMEHAPTTMAYLVSNWSLPIMAGAFAFVALNPWIAAAFGISTALGLGYLFKYKSFNTQSFLAKKEWLLAKDFALETLLLMGKTPLNTFSYGSINPKFLDNKIENLQQKNYNNLLTEKERKLLSECAQEVATKFNNYMMYTTFALLAKFVFMALAGGDDDDDDDTYIQKKIRQLVNIENIVNSLINDRNQTLSDINRYISPNQLYNDATAFSFFRSLARDASVTKKVITGGYEDKENSEMFYDISKLSFVPGLNMIPNNAKKAVAGMFNKDMGVFSDNRVYEGKDAIDKFFNTEMKQGEDYYKAKVSDERISIRDEAKKYFEKQVESENPDMAPKEYEDEVKDRLDDFMKETKKNKDDTNKDLYESGILEQKKQELEELKNSN